ncbi:MAG: SPOR domain-containing protein [Candidatus Omnitrophica bacterium]|nr:SPOR domain-containing protein [Candidatus Omnitrophota bacterium]
MEKENNLQLELFTQPEGTSIPGGQNINSSFWRFIRTFEKTIMIIIATAVISIISFSLGVEKGKHLSKLDLKKDRQLDISTIKQRVETPVVSPVQTQTVPQQIKTPAPAILEKQGYTIQLASYKTKISAQKEAESLKKRGLLPFVIIKGSYAVLCVGNFNNKETAQSLLSQLKNRYRGCYIRRL